MKEVRRFRRNNQIGKSCFAPLRRDSGAVHGLSDINLVLDSLQNFCIFLCYYLGICLPNIGKLNLKPNGHYGNVGIRGWNNRAVGMEEFRLVSVSQRVNGAH